MDPITQGVLGATWSLNGVSSKRKDEIKKALWLGWLSGMAPDLDIFIKSQTDPLLFLEYHRHFTHSLVFIPFGALICTLILNSFFKLSWTRAYLYCFLGFASHALLDSCTSYGTQLFWPFSNFRVAWDIVSIVDLAYTIPLLYLVFRTAKKKSLRWSRYALIFSFAYMFLGAFQHHRAIEILKAKAVERNHIALRIHAKPSFGNMILYRGIYETEDKFYTDAVRVPLLGRALLFEGGSLPKFQLSDHPEITQDSVLAKDIKRFAWFSNDFLVWHPTQKGVLADFRYSMLPDSAKHFLWGIRVDTSKPNEHTPYITMRDVDASSWKHFWTLLWN